jgi:hypothetical protein
MQRQESPPPIWVEGEFTVTSAAELKNLPIQRLAPGKELRLDLKRADGIDITLTQLLWAARREAERTRASVVIRLSDAARMAARNAGFEWFPGLPVQA